MREALSQSSGALTDSVKRFSINKRRDKACDSVPVTILPTHFKPRFHMSEYVHSSFYNICIIFVFASFSFSLNQHFAQRVDVQKSFCHSRDWKIDNTVSLFSAPPPPHSRPPPLPLSISLLCEGI